ncbi:alpha/beta hydrolase, partial [Pseudomonas sp. CAN2814]|uniref:alpha/beta fold hydrolase n=1 Tax=Pseudomonas sp. CAN1 TaxID=3046726 RepID=UPI0026480C0B
LSLHGEQDEYGSATHPQRISSLPGVPSVLQLLPECGHVPHREQPAVVLEVVADFLRQHRP